jgi:hypothetical protein
MSSHFWDVPQGVLRDESDISDQHFEFGGSHENQNGFPTESSWMWTNESFEQRAGGALFDFTQEVGFLGSKINSEPVSPSSVATTPTASEHPVITRNQSPYMDLGDSHISQISVSKRQRKAGSSPSAIERNGRKKKYDAPPGVWRNSGGFISTVYINKKRVYGPLRREVADAVKDREEMLMAKQVIFSEEGMRAFVQGMKERCGSNRQLITTVDMPLTSGSPMSSSSVSHQNISSIRVSSRPIRAAAKRNLFASYSLSADETEEVATEYPEAIEEQSESPESSSFY